MTTELVPIFKLRELCLAIVNPMFYKKNADVIRRASLAAQEYLFSGACNEYKSYMAHNFHDLPGYRAIYEKYNLSGLVNDGLIMDLTWAFRSDVIHGIIDYKGNIKNNAKLYRSRTMEIYHSTTLSGIPINAFKLYPERINKLLVQAQQKVQ